MHGYMYLDYLTQKNVSYVCMVILVIEKRTNSLELKPPVTDDMQNFKWNEMIESDVIVAPRYWLNHTVSGLI